MPGICPEKNLNKITTKELKQFLASYYSPSRMVLAAVNVDHDQLVDLTKQYFVNVKTSWDGVEHRGIDQSVSQYSPGEVKVGLCILNLHIHITHSNLCTVPFH